MAKRFASMFFIMVGVVVFLLASFFMVLLIAPGFNIFGIKYIVINTHGLNTGKVKITDVFKQKYGNGDFSGSVIVNSTEVPVIVEFAEAGQDYYYQYYDNYSGITKSTFDDPSILVERDENGNAVLTVKSFESFIFQNANSTRYIKLFIPLADISVTQYPGKQQYIYGESDPGAANKYQTNLEINCNTASVTFYNYDKTRAPAFNLLKIKTTGIVNYNGNQIKAMTFDFETNKTIRLGSSVVSIADAKNYNFKTSSGNIIAERELLGDLFASTINGTISLNRCNNFTAKTELGNIVSCFDNRGIRVSGIVDIDSKAGNIDIEQILGQGQNKIKTGSGNIKIETIKNGEIQTHRGSVDIKSVNNMIISTNMGSVSIEEALESIEVTTKRGKIRLGGEGMILNSPKAISHLGKIEIIDAIGEVYLETISSDVKFINKNSQNIKIISGGDLDAQNLKGIVDVTVCKTAYLEFDSISQETKVLMKQECSYVKIDALNTKRTSLYYLIAGKPANLYESNNTGYQTFSLIETKNFISNTNLNGIKFEVLGDSQDGNSNSKVDIYFDKSSNF